MLQYQETDFSSPKIILLRKKSSYTWVLIKFHISQYTLLTAFKNFLLWKFLDKKVEKESYNETHVPITQFQKLLTKTIL